MNKYRQHEYKQVKERRWPIHPIWRGIGCALIILVPLMAYAGAILFQQANNTYRWFNVPSELSGSIDLTTVVQRVLHALSRIHPYVAQYINPFAVSLPRLPNIEHMVIALTLAFLALGFGLLTVVYSAIYRFFGPSRYGPLDIPPIRHSPMPKSRYK